MKSMRQFSSGIRCLALTLTVLYSLASRHLVSCQRSSVGIAQRHQKRSARRVLQPMPGMGKVHNAALRGEDECKPALGW